MEFLGHLPDNIRIYRVRYIFGSMNQWTELLIEEGEYRLLERAYEAGKNDMRREFQALVRVR
jgi:hypothetical protein